MRFEGKVVVVTGAGHGIGRATARRFAGEGAQVVVVDMNESGAAETVDLITAEGGIAQAMVADVSDERRWPTSALASPRPTVGSTSCTTTRGGCAAAASPTSRSTSGTSRSPSTSGRCSSCRAP